MHFQLPRWLSLSPIRSHYVLQLYCPRKQVYVFLHHVIVFCSFTNIISSIFCPFLNVWVTAVSQSTCFVFCKSLHRKQIPLLAVMMSLLPLIVLSSHIPASWSAFFRLISFLPYHSRLYWCFFSSIPFFFLVCLYFWTSNLFNFSYQDSCSHQMCVMQDVCCLSTFRRLMWKGKGHKPSDCLVMRGVSVQGILAPEENPCLPHSEEIWGLHQEEDTFPTPLCFLCMHVPLRLDAHECASVASQSRSHINGFRPPRS